MIANLIGGFVAIIVGVSLIGPVAGVVNTVAGGPVVNASNTSQILAQGGALYNSSTWGATVLQLVPGFFALGILGVGIAVTYSALRESGII
jgi:hypothetical protein